MPLGLAALAIAAVVGVNLADEEIQPATKAMMARPEMGKVEDTNGYVDFLGLGAPMNTDSVAWGREVAKAYAAQGEPGFRKTPEWESKVKAQLVATKEAAGWCTLEKEDCLALAKYGRDARLDNAQNSEILKRYRAMREKPVFADLPTAGGMLSTVPTYPNLLSGASLARLDIALKAVGGDMGGAVAELDREVLFHRRIMEGGNTLVTVMVGNSLLARDLLLASEMLRAGGDAVVPFRGSLLALTEFSADVGLLNTGMRNEAAMGMEFASGLREKLRKDEFRSATGLMQASPKLLASALSLTARDNETLNRLAARYVEAAEMAKVPTDKFIQARKAAQAKQGDTLPVSGFQPGLVNPIGRGIADLMVPSFVSFAARMHDLEALRRMVRLQAIMAAKGIVEPAAMAAFVAGEGAKTDFDPYTGKPFAFDPATKRLSFTPAGTGALVTALGKRYDGKVAIEL